jgi:predicted lysophospholipase L1 biosynthesis ABC-type transport system permease subunit
MTGSLGSVTGDRVMLLASAVAILHLLLHVRVALCFRADPRSTVFFYAVFTSVMNLLEAAVWLVGLLVLPQDEYRWAIFLGGFILSLRVPRGVLPNDFQGELFCAVC